MRQGLGDYTEQAEGSRLAALRDVAVEYGQKAMALAGVIGAATLAGCGLIGESSKSSEKTLKGASPAAVSSASRAAIEKTCAGTEDANTAGNNYQNGHFFPSTNSPLENANQASDITKQWFDKDGPLAGKADAGSLAVMNALVAVPFNAKDTNNDYNAHLEFRTVLNQIRDLQTGSDTAEKICADDYTAIASTVGYDTIAKGETYQLIRAVNGSDNNQIVGFIREQHTAPASFPVITFRYQNQKNNTGNGFTEVDVDTNGRILIPGELPRSGQQQQRQQNRGGASGQAQRGTGQGTNVTQGAGGGGANAVQPNRVGNNQGETNKNQGPKENQPQGKIPGQKPGPGPGQPGGPSPAQPGPGPTPSGGGGPGAPKPPEAPPTATTPPPTGTTPPPTATTPPPPPPPPPPPTTSTSPTKPPKPACDPNIDNC